jgi:SAM-dependent methyltransferase
VGGTVTRNATASGWSEADAVAWHELECGGYAADLELWHELAAAEGDPVLDVGAGSGRVALALARASHEVVALDHDPALLAALEAQARGMSVSTVCADARELALGRQFALCIVPMQTIQLLGGSGGRQLFLERARLHLGADGVLAIAISEHLELYEVDDGLDGPLPDIRELDGVLYSSQPTAVRADQRGFVLERRRETVRGDGRRTVEQDVIRIDPLSATQLEREAKEVELEPAGRIEIPPTPDHVGSVVVMLRA